jgi:hypothetical protein
MCPSSVSLNAFTWPCQIGSALEGSKVTQKKASPKGVRTDGIDGPEKVTERSMISSSASSRSVCSCAASRVVK